METVPGKAKPQGRLVVSTQLDAKDELEEVGCPGITAAARLQAVPRSLVASEPGNHYKETGWSYMMASMLVSTTSIVSLAQCYLLCAWERGWGRGGLRRHEATRPTDS